MTNLRTQTKDTTFSQEQIGIKEINLSRKVFPSDLSNFLKDVKCGVIESDNR